jgi:hypothetical protein
VRWGVVEDAADSHEHAIEVVEDFVVPKGKDTIAVSREFRRAAIVSILRERVLAAIEFGGELRLWTGEVDDALADRMLATKFPCGESVAQRVPE